MNSVYGGIAKLGVMFILASQPGLQETGAVLAIGFGVLITSFLHIATLRKNKATATGFTMFAIAIRILYFDGDHASYLHPDWRFRIVNRMRNHYHYSYLLFLFLTGQVKKSDLRHVQKIDKDSLIFFFKLIFQLHHFHMSNKKLDSHLAHLVFLSSCIKPFFGFSNNC